MRVIKENYKLCIVLYAFWMVLTMDFHFTNLTFGLIISIIVTIASNGIVYDKKGFKVHLPKPMKMIKFVSRLMFEIYKSSFSYIVRIIKKDCDPVFIKITLDTKDPLIITMISNAITLTPGTLTVYTEGNELTVLSIDDPKREGKDIAKEIKEKYEKIFK